MNQAEGWVLLLIVLNVVGIERWNLARIVDAADIAGLHSGVPPPTTVELVLPAARNCLQEALVLKRADALARPFVYGLLEYVGNGKLSEQFAPVDRIVVDWELRFERRLLPWLRSHLQYTCRRVPRGYRIRWRAVVRCSRRACCYIRDRPMSVDPWRT